MARVVILDMLFHWPPDGGARVEVLELTRYFSKRHETTLLVPAIRDVFPRGVLEVPAEKLGVDLQTLAVPDTVEHYRPLRKLIGDHLRAMRPDLLVMADAWHLKPRLLAALGRFKPVVRFFAHEGLCLKGHGHLFRDGQVCRVDTLAKPGDYEEFCLPCRNAWRDSSSTRIFDRGMQMAGLEDGTYVEDLRRGLASAGAVIVANKDMASRLAPHTRRVLVQGMGTDPALFHKMSEPSGRRFLFLGRAEDFLKGGHVFLEAGRLLRKRREDFTLAITGRPPRLGKEGRDDWVEILEPVPHEKVPQLIDGALAVVLAPIWPEPLPISMFEVLACGRPLIASCVGGLKDWIKNRGNGLAVPPNDPAALADAMQVLLDDGALVRKLSQAAETIGRRQTWDYVFDKVYGSLAAEL
jgi:glycosyltransferase involved in cell wall biosynthesis